MTNPTHPQPLPHLADVFGSALHDEDSEYNGPDELRLFSRFMPYVGEVIMAFSRLERYLTWGIESCLEIPGEQANAIEQSIQSVTTRIVLFSTLAGRHTSTDDKQRQILDSIIKKIHKLNNYRNRIIHGSWHSVSGEIDAAGRKVQTAIHKSRFAPLGSNELTSTAVTETAVEMRQMALEMLATGQELQQWVLRVFPNAENRVP